VNPPQEELANEPTSPYLFVWTSHPMPGLPVLGSDNRLDLRVAGLPANSPLSKYDIAIDGIVVSRGRVGKLERVRVAEELLTGEHSVAAIFRGALQGQDFVLRSNFVKASEDNGQ
jgi:hypothetical protein